MRIMDYQGIAIVGPRGAGKSALCLRLCEKHSSLQMVPAVTTRKKRKDDTPDQYEYMGRREFKKLGKENRFLIKAEYAGENYGILKEQFLSVLQNEKTPVLILTPESLTRTEDFFSIFIDLPDPILNEGLKHRRQKIDETVESQRDADRSHAKSCLYVVQNHDSGKSAELIWSLWKYRNTGGVLPKRLIQLMMECGMLLEHAEASNVQSASYDLSLGDEYYSGGKIKELTSKDPFVLIKPYDYAIVTSKENADFPRDVAGRFDLSVSLFCQGVILSNGPQVDPGFKGKLFCLLFNTSNSPVILKRNQHYATLEFHKLLEPTTPYQGRYQSKLGIINYLPSNTLMGAVSELKEELEKVRSESRRLQTIVLGIVSALLTIVALLIALD